LISARVKGSRDENFQLATYFHYRLSVRHETDRQTDNDHHSIMPPPPVCGREHNNARCCCQECPPGSGFWLMFLNYYIFNTFSGVFLTKLCRRCIAIAPLEPLSRGLTRTIQRAAYIGLYTCGDGHKAWLDI